MNKSSIEKARAEFRGNEFGEYENPAPSPWAGILWLWALLVALGALVWLYGCTPAVADVPAEAQEMQRAFNSQACRLHKSTEARVACAADMVWTQPEGAYTDQSQSKDFQPANQGEMNETKH